MEKVKEESKQQLKQTYIWQCNICPSILKLCDSPNFDDFKKVTSHCYEHLKENDDNEVTCPVCERKYKVFKNFVHYRPSSRV